MEILTYINDTPVFAQIIPILPSNQSLKSRARALRKIGNFPEVVFWMQVRNKTFHSIDFDRHRVIGSFIVDFYVKKLGLIIEIDGESHNNKEDYDRKRNEFLESLGLKIFCVSNFRILHDLDNVMKELEVFIIERFSIISGV